VPNASLQSVAPVADLFIIDIKDADDRIYTAYTGKTNRLVWDNLTWLAAHYDRSRVVIRVPLIPEFNTPADVERSMERISQMGFSQLDKFTYKNTLL
jgi:pyruvate formate lyase activating enzyme